MMTLSLLALVIVIVGAIYYLIKFSIKSNNLFIIEKTETTLNNSMSLNLLQTGAIAEEEYKRYESKFSCLFLF